MSEAELDQALTGARLGDERSMAVLYRGLQPSLRRYFARRAPGAEDDLASETWLAATRLLAAFDGSLEDLRILLFTIARRRLADHFRRQSRAPYLVPVDDVAELAAPAAEGLALDALAARHAIDQLTAALPPLQAEVVLLRVVADLSVADVARVVGRSPGAVRVLQHRALQHLAKRPGGIAVTS